MKRDCELKKVMIIGASGHAKVIIDIIRSNFERCEIALLDDAKPIGTMVNSCEVVGTLADIPRYTYWKFVIAIGDNAVRKKIALSYDLCYATVIHSAAWVSDSAKIGDGTVIMPRSVVNADASIGAHCIVNTGAIIEHECKLDDFVHVSPAAALAGNVHVGERSWIGMGACVKNNLKIGAGVTIGAGAVVVRDIEESGVYAGVPAKFLKELEK